ncbi:MAG: HTH domain-containing protein [Haloarculaceae archaeon]
MPSHSIDLHERQRHLLRTVLNEYEQREGPVKTRDLADVLDRTPGTVRNRMQELLALQLVESTAGRCGGYAPTDRGYRSLGRDPETDSREVTRMDGPVTDHR